MLKYVVLSASQLLDYLFRDAINPPDNFMVSGRFQMCPPASYAFI